MTHVIVDPPPGKPAAPAGLLRGWSRDLKIAMIFFTRVPVAYQGALGLGELKRAWRAVPLVGAVIGAVGAAVYLGAHRLGAPEFATALLAVLATALLTGALHEDGLADFTDGAGGGRDATQRLAIMRDSRIGCYGALALVFSVALRASALVAFAEPRPAALALIVAHAIARTAIPAALWVLPPARGDGLGAEAGRPERAALLIALALGAVIALGLAGPKAGAMALVAAVIAAAAVAAMARRLVGGYTGDVLGAIEQAAEITVLLTLATAMGTI